jgi:hypothetical protein
MMPSTQFARNQWVRPRPSFATTDSEVTMKFKPEIAAAALLAASSASALAHHSFAMFDGDKTVSMTGTLKELEWTNPHAWIRIEIADPATGQPQEWSFEMGSPAQLGARGLKPDSMKPGDKIIVKAHPMKDGSHGGQYMSVAFADGRPVTGGTAR